jgi:hypothetical protein
MGLGQPCLDVLLNCCGLQVIICHPASIFLKGAAGRAVTGDAAGVFLTTSLSYCCQPPLQPAASGHLHNLLLPVRSLFSSFMYFCLVLFRFPCRMCTKWKPCIYGSKSVMCIVSRCMENRYADFLNPFCWLWHRKCYLPWSLVIIDSSHNFLVMTNLVAHFMFFYTWVSQC